MSDIMHAITSVIPSLRWDIFLFFEVIYSRENLTGSSLIGLPGKLRFIESITLTVKSECV